MLFKEPGRKLRQETFLVGFFLDAADLFLGTSVLLWEFSKFYMKYEQLHTKC